MPSRQNTCLSQKINFRRFILQLFHSMPNFARFFGRGFGVAKFILCFFNQLIFIFVYVNET